MWDTSNFGERTLHGAEARLFAATVDRLISDLSEGHRMNDECRTGRRYFDERLTYGQKIAALVILSNCLLREEVPAIQTDEALDAATDAVFEHLGGLVEIEVESGDGDTYWRKGIIAALRQFHLALESEESPEEWGIPEATCGDTDKWESAIDTLRDGCLCEAAYDFEDLYSDLPPEAAEGALQMDHLPKDYFSVVVNDLDDAHAESEIEKLRKLLRFIYHPEQEEQP